MMKSKTFLLPFVACCMLESVYGFLPVTAQSSDLKIEAYTTRINEQILDSWQNLNEKESQKKFGPTDILITIDGTGAITDIKVESSSGDKARDLSIVKAIRKFSRVEAPPDKELFELSMTFATDPQSSKTVKNNVGVRALQANDFDKAITKLTEVWKKYPVDVLARQNLATAYNNRALMEVEQKKLAAAKVDLERAYGIDPRMLTLTNMETLYRRNRDPHILQFLLPNLRTPLVAKFGPAEELFELYAKVAIDCQSAGLNRECLQFGFLALHLDPENKQIKWPERISLRSSMAMAQSGLKRDDEAIRIERTNLVETEKSKGKDSIETADVLNNLADICMRVNPKSSEAEMLMSKALQIADKQPKPVIEKIIFLINYAVILSKEKKTDEASRAFDQAATELMAGQQSKPETIYLYLQSIARNRASQGDFAGAIASANICENFAIEKFGAGTIASSNITYMKGDIYRAKKDYKHAESDYKQVLDLRSKLLPVGDRRTANVLKDYVKVLRLDGLIAEAEMIEARLKVAPSKSETGRQSMIELHEPSRKN